MQRAQANRYEIIKRTIDIGGSLILGIIFLPLAILTAIAVTLDSAGPIFADTPERVGRYGRTFRMFKFRSMIINAHAILRTDPLYKDLYQQYKKDSFKLRNDPRVTRVGRFIRRHSLDEIPQLINVLRGEMSLVGPRAYYPDELREQQKKYPSTK